MQISPIRQQKYNNNFTALKKVQCWRKVSEGFRCSSLESRIMDELKELAKVNKFFKDNDVNAIVSVVGWTGTKIVLKSKPAAKTFVNKIKNLFVSPQLCVISNNHVCPDESSYRVAKNLREVKEGKKDISTIFTSWPN